MLDSHQDYSPSAADTLTLSAPATAIDAADVWAMEEEYSAGRRAELESLYEKTLADLAPQGIVKGSIVGFDDREVMVNIGFKSEGVIPISEFRDLREMKVGQEVDVFIESIEDKQGQLSLSRKKATAIRTWDRIINAMDEEIVLEGVVKRRTKGGFVVDLMGIEAFLPGSQIDVKPIRDYDYYVNQRMEFKVVKINHAQHNVVISHKALIEKDLEAQKAQIINNLERGQVLEGTVKNITSFGVFIDLGGVDGLLHITDISWGRINSPDEVLQLDQKVNIVVLDFDDEKKRISLGLKQLQPHPWDDLPEHIQIGATVDGRVVTIADYGIFIELTPGVEGLIHVSELSWSQHPKNPNELFKIGDTVKAVVLNIDREERKMSLGIKQLSEDPWTHASSKFPVNSRHTGIVRNITNYGLFIELEEGVDGLIHVQDLSWTKKINHPSEFIQKDEKLEVVVLELDVENRRLRLGHKQLNEDPWETFETVFPVDSVHQGTVSTILKDKGALVELAYGVEGFVPSKHLKTEGDKAEAKEGDQLPFKVIDFNKELRRIVLSHALTWREALEEEKAAARKAKAANAGRAEQEEDSGPVDLSVLGPVEKGTFGDLDALAQLKKSMQAAEGVPETPPAPEAKTETPAPEVDTPVAAPETPAEDAPEAAVEQSPEASAEDATESAAPEAPAAEAETEENNA